MLKLASDWTRIYRVRVLIFHFHVVYIIIKICQELYMLTDELDPNNLKQYEFDPKQFRKLRNYYYTILYLDKKNCSFSNITLPNNCLGITDDIWKTDLEPCCINGYFSLPFYCNLNEIYNSKIIASLFVFCRVFMFYIRN